MCILIFIICTGYASKELLGVQSVRQECPLPDVLHRAQTAVRSSGGRGGGTQGEEDCLHDSSVEQVHQRVSSAIQLYPSILSVSTTVLSQSA